jgi:hypothetical protein
MENKCLSKAPNSPVVIEPPTNGPAVDPRITCLANGGAWNTTTKSCVTANPAQPPAATSGPVIGQFVRIERVGPSLDLGPDGTAINLGEMAVYGPNKQSLLPGATITAGSTYYGLTAPSSLIDSDVNTVAHTDPGAAPYNQVWFQVNLGSNKEIAQVVVTNRQDCCQGRAVGLRIVVLNSSGNAVYASAPITTTQNSYVFDTIA